MKLFRLLPFLLCVSSLWAQVGGYSVVTSSHVDGDIPILSKTRQPPPDTPIFYNLFSVFLDGVDESVSVADDADFTFGNNTGAGGTDVAFSWTLWTKLESTPVQLQGLICKRNGVDFNNEFYSFCYDGGVRFVLDSYGATGNWIGRNTNSSLMSTGVWYFLSGTYSGNETSAGIKIYVDAVRVDNANNASGTYTGIGNTTMPVSIGSIATGFYLDGKIFHPAIWDKELSSAEITEIMNAGESDYRTVSCVSNLISAWYFPTGSADYPTYTDYNSTHDGTMINMDAGDIDPEIP